MVCGGWGVWFVVCVVGCEGCGVCGRKWICVVLSHGGCCLVAGVKPWEVSPFILPPGTALGKGSGLNSFLIVVLKCGLQLGLEQNPFVGLM